MSKKTMTPKEAAKAEAKAGQKPRVFPKHGGKYTGGKDGKITLADPGTLPTKGAKHPMEAK